MKDEGSGKEEAADPRPGRGDAVGTPSSDGDPSSTADDGGESEPSEEGGEAMAEHEALRARLSEIESELAALQESQEETKQLWLRSRADYDNLKRRTEREREDIRKAAAARLMGELLPQIEILDRAARELGEVDEAHAKGIQMAVSGLRNALAREGLQQVPGEGNPFDPGLHEAVAREPSDSEPGTILQVIRPGYKLHDRLLQAALVKVSAGRQTDEPIAGEPAASDES